jgi:hypothetical protein
LDLTSRRNARIIPLHLAGPTLIAAGTQEQQARYLGPTLRGEII